MAKGVFLLIVILIWQMYMFPNGKRCTPLNGNNVMAKYMFANGKGVFLFMAILIWQRYIFSNGKRCIPLNGNTDMAKGVFLLIVILI